MQWIVVTGSPVDGLAFYGPFEDQDEAISYGEHEFEEWWVAPLNRADDVVEVPMISAPRNEQEFEW